MKSSQTESLYHIGACEDDSGREEITIIPTNWIFAKGFCVWPTKAPNKNTSKLICKRIDHQATDYGWIECRYRPLYTEIYSYEDALKYEREAIETSDIGTPENPTRKKFAPNRLISSSSDDEDSPYPVIPDSLKGAKLKGSVKQNLFPQLDDASLTSNDDATEIVENEHLERTAKRRAEKVLSPPKSTKKTKISKVNHVAKEDDSMLETKTSGPSAKEMSQPGVEKKTAPLISDKDATMRVAKKRVEKELTPLKPMRKTKFSKVNHVAEEDDSLLETETSGPSVKEIPRPAVEKRTAPSTSDKDATMRTAKKRVEKELTPLKPMRKTKISKVNHATEEDDFLLENETSEPLVKEIHQPTVQKVTPRTEEEIPHTEEDTYDTEEQNLSTGKVTPRSKDKPPVVEQQTPDNNLQQFREQFEELNMNEKLFYISNSLRVMNRNLKVVVKTTNSHSSILEKLCRKANPATEDLNQLIEKLQFNFPMLHSSEFLDLNKKIAMMIDEKVNEEFDAEFRDELKIVLRQHNGGSLVESVNNIFGFLMEDELARHYSLKGHKGKRKFVDYEICDIIHDILCALHPDDGRPACQKKMAWWLGHAQERIRVKNEKRARVS